MSARKEPEGLPWSAEVVAVHATRHIAAAGAMLMRLAAMRPRRDVHGVLDLLFRGLHGAERLVSAPAGGCDVRTTAAKAALELSRAEMATEALARRYPASELHWVIPMFIRDARSHLELIAEAWNGKA